MKTPFRNTYWVIEGKFLAGMYPGSYSKEMNFENLKKLTDLYTETMVDLTEEHEETAYFNGTYVEKYIELADKKNFNANYFRFPIKDMDIPSVELMISILDRIDKCLDSGNRIYLHCIGGTGRTGTVVGCWLIRHGRSDPDSVIEKIAELRGDGKRSPETEEQVRFVRNWKKGM